MGLRRVTPLVVIWSLLAAATAARADVAVITRVPADAEVLRQLAGLLDERVIDHPEPDPRSLPAVMRAAAGWPERHVVVIDRAGSSVHVLRPSDQTIASRLLEEDVLADAPYAVALATAELLEWLGVSARSEASDGARDDATSGGARESAAGTPTTEPEPRAQLDFALGLGLELSASPGFDPVLTRLALEAGVALGRMRRPLWLWLSLRGALLGPAWRAPLAGADSEVEHVDYASSSFTVHGALGLGGDGAALTLGPVAGIALAQVEAVDRDGEPLGDYDGISPLAGLALGLRYPLGWGFALSLGAEGQWLLQPARFRVEGRKVVEEGPLQVMMRFGLLWESAP